MIFKTMLAQYGFTRCEWEQYSFTRQIPDSTVTKIISVFQPETLIL